MKFSQKQKAAKPAKSFFKNTPQILKMYKGSRKKKRENYRTSN
jgi:hypothetical protein